MSAKVFSHQLEVQVKTLLVVEHALLALEAKPVCQQASVSAHDNQ